MRKKEEEAKYYKVDIGVYYIEIISSHNDMKRDHLYIKQGISSFLFYFKGVYLPGGVDVIVDANGRDIITGEQYYECKKRWSKELGLFRSHNILHVPYFCYDDKDIKSNVGSDYNKLFYSRALPISNDRVLSSLKIVQKCGKEEYIKKIEEIRERVMNEAYGLISKEKQTNEDIKSLIHKINNK